MKSVRILVLMVALGIALLPAVVLRSGGALANAPKPSVAQIAEFCVLAIEDYVNTLRQMKRGGVPKDAVVQANKDQNSPDAVYKLIDAVYDNARFTEDDYNATLKACIEFNQKKLADQI